jgi:hypothetical protein
VSPVETILVFAVIPLALYGVIALLTMREKTARTPRYRAGQEWEHPPVWWSANPAGLGADHPVNLHAPHAHGDHAPAPAGSAAEPVRTAKGGARGNW